MAVAVSVAWAIGLAVLGFKADIRGAKRARVIAGARVDDDVSRRVGPIVAVNAALQKVTQPAARFPGLRSPHAWQEGWTVGASAEQFVEALRTGIPRLNDDPSADGFVYELDSISASASGGELQVSVYTKLRWLDVVAIKVFSTGEDTCTAEVRVCSTGLVPLSIPAAAIANLAVFWFPFSDIDLSDKRTCPDLRKAAGGIAITVESKGRQL